MARVPSPLAPGLSGSACAGVDAHLGLPAPAHPAAHQALPRGAQGPQLRALPLHGHQPPFEARRPQLRCAEGPRVVPYPDSKRCSWVSRTAEEVPILLFDALPAQASCLQIVPAVDCIAARCRTGMAMPAAGCSPQMAASMPLPLTVGLGTPPHSREAVSPCIRTCSMATAGVAVAQSQAKGRPCTDFLPAYSTAERGLTHEYCS